MSSFISFPPKLYSSTIQIEADFSAQLQDGEAIVSCVMSVTVYSGLDLTPSAMLDGGPVLLQNIVTQQLTGGEVGVLYLIGFNGTTNLSSQLIIQAYLAVVDSNPILTPA